jgi:hypothetical protein
VTHAPSLATLAVTALTACGGGSSSHVTPAPTAGSDSTLTATSPHRDPVDCAALDGPDLPSTTLGSDWLVAHHAATRTTPSASGDTTIGVIADASNAAPATLAALGRLRAQLDAAHVDVVLALGMAATTPDLEATIAALATGSTWPVVVIPGDLEPAAAHDAALVALRNRHLAVIDGRLTRWVELPGATIATLPGAGTAARLAAGADGCGYRPAERDALVTALAQRPTLRILASLEAPRGPTSAPPTGDLELPPHPSIDLVIHAAADAASPPATGTRDAAAISLTPGTADATPRLTTPRHPPTAAVLAIHGDHWSWHVLVDTP